VAQAARPPLPRRPEINTGAPDYSGASEYAMRAVPGATRPDEGRNVAPPPVARVVPAYSPSAPAPVVAPPPSPEVTPGMAGSTVDPFVTAQNTRAAVARSEGARVGGELAQTEAQIAVNRQEYYALDAQIQGLYNQYGDGMTAEQAQEISALEAQQRAITEETNSLVNTRQEQYGSSPVFGLVVPILEIAGTPANWAQGGLGQVGWWILDNKDSPYVEGAVNGLFSVVPGGQVAIAELNKLGIGPTDYVAYIQQNAAQAETIRTEGYTSKDGTFYAPGDGNGLWAFYTDSLNLPQEVVAEAWSDPTSYLAVGRSVGGAVVRRADEAALQSGRETAGTRLARGIGRSFELPQRVIDEPLDRGIEALGRGARGLIPDAWLETPLAAQVDNIVNQIGNIFRNEDVARRQLAQGETSARRGVGVDQREFADTSVPYDPTPAPAAAQPPAPVAPVEPGSQYRTQLPGDTVMIDQGQQPQWYPAQPFRSVPERPYPALPSGPIPEPAPDPYLDLMNDYNAAIASGDQAAADAIARRMDEMQAEDAVDYDAAANPPTEDIPVDSSPVPPGQPRYTSPDQVPIRDQPGFRRGTGPAEVGDGDNLLVVDRSDDGKRWTIYGGDEYPNYPSRAAAITVARREAYRVEQEAFEGATRRAPVDALTGDDLYSVEEIDGGGYGAFLPDDDVALVTGATTDEVRAAVADLDADDLPTGQGTLPTDPQTQWRQFGVGRAKMVDAVLERADDYTERGLAPQVDAWLKWREDFVEGLNAERGTPSASTPPLQSVRDRMEEEVRFAQMVGEAPPDQTMRNAADGPRTAASQAEFAVFGTDSQARNARKWFHQRGSKRLEQAIEDAEWGFSVRTHEDAAQYLKWLRDRRQGQIREAIESGGQMRMFAAGANVNLPSFRDLYRSISGNRSTNRRLKAARLAAARARMRSPLPRGITRRPILSDAEERLVNTRIADLGRVGRADTVKDGVVTPRARGAGDTATVREVYDAAREAGQTHDQAMEVVRNRIVADFGGLPDTRGWFIRGVDTYTNFVTTMARYGTPIAGARSIQSDMVGDFMQTFLREGPVTAAEMIVKSAGYVRRGFKWADTRAGEIAEGWGLDVKSLSPREGIVRSEVAGNAVKSPVRRILAPKFGKVDLDKVPINPGKAVARNAEVFRGINDQMEMGRRTALKLSMVDGDLLRERRTFAARAAQHRRLAQGVNITDDELAATVASLERRFSPEDIRLAMERLAADKGANARAAANFGERIGRDWANVRNVAIDNATKRVNRALFSYEFTKADEIARRFVPFHYWSSRAIPFYVETAIRNPAFALAYYRMVEGLAERSEAEGWPDSLRFMVKIWTGPMGYIFFADPVANMGLLGVTEMLYPNDFDDGNTSSLGRFLQLASGRGGVGVTPIITSLMAYAGLMGEDPYALDFTGTRAVRNLIGAAVHVAAGTGLVGDPTLLDRPVEELMQQGRLYASRWASQWIPGAREIPVTDPNAYPKLQIRNGMVDLLMQERGYTSIDQLTEDDWALIDDQFEAAEGTLYEDAVANYSWAMLGREGAGVLTGRRSVRQEGQLSRSTSSEGQADFETGQPRPDPRQNPFGQPAPGQAPTPAQAYETQANLNGRYGRTGAGTSLPQYDPYADYQITAGEQQFMNLWHAEYGTPYEAGDLETLRERTATAESLVGTTPEAAPLVRADAGWRSIGPAEDADLIGTYWNIVFADPSVGTIYTGADTKYTPEELKGMSSDQRGEVADEWLAGRDPDGSARETLKQRKLWEDAHPEYAAYKDWGREVRDAWENEGGLTAYRAAISTDNANAERYFADLERAVRRDLGPDATPQEIRDELDRRTTTVNAYLAVNGTKRRLDDPNPLGVGEPGPVSGPYDPRPAGFEPDAASGAGGDGGSTSRPDSSGTRESSPGGGGGSSQSREEAREDGRRSWAVEVVAQSEAGVAQANALLTSQMGYPVDIAQLPGPVREAALAMLPPGLIPEDAWLYFDYLAWQEHQRLQGGPVDLLSYLTATSGDRDWKAQRTTSSAGGATLVGGTPAETFIPQGWQRTQGSYSSYLAGG
jgi:hypothetical protein